MICFYTKILSNTRNNGLLATKLVADTYFFLGKQKQLRDSVARVLPFWSSRAAPLKSYLHGMYAFGLVETNFYAKAETEAFKVNVCVFRTNIYKYFFMFRV